MYANEYAAHSGLPLNTVKRLCRENKIPHLHLGRNYSINAKLADEAVFNMMFSCPEEKVSNSEQSKSTRFKQSDFMLGLKASLYL